MPTLCVALYVNSLIQPSWLPYKVGIFISSLQRTLNALCKVTGAEIGELGFKYRYVRAPVHEVPFIQPARESLSA